MTDENAYFLKIQFKFKFISNKSILIWLTTIMVTMKLFARIQAYFDAAGFHTPRPSQICEFNRRNGYYIMAVAGMFYPVTGFFCSKGKTMFEYCGSFNLIITTASTTTYFIIFLHKMGTIRNLIKTYEELAEKRERRFDFDLFFFCWKIRCCDNDNENNKRKFFCRRNRNEI